MGSTLRFLEEFLKGGGPTEFKFTIEWHFWKFFFDTLVERIIKTSSS